MGVPLAGSRRGETITSGAASPFDYGVDAKDKIRSLSDSWLGFARANGAPQLTRDTVIGRCLWDYVAGDTTRELYEVIFAQVRRLQEKVVLPFRCDSPDRFRFMQLVVAPTGGADLEISGILVREQARPYLPILDRLRPRSPGRLPMCSICLRVQILGTQWLEVTEAVERLDLFESVRLPSLDYQVCAGCRRGVREPQALGSPS